MVRRAALLVCVCRGDVGRHVPENVAVGPVRMSDKVRDATCGTGGHGAPAAAPALVKDARSLVRVAPLPVAQHHVAPVRVAQRGTSRAARSVPSGMFLQLHEPLVVPGRKGLVLAKIV